MKSRSKWRLGAIAMGLAVVGFLVGGCQSQQAQATVKPTRVSVHDPSIFYDQQHHRYYVYGSHLAAAESSNLYNWKELTHQEYQNPSPILGQLDQNLAPIFKWAGHNDGNANPYAIWAPDLIWDAHYQWPNGKKGAYLFYFCVSSTWRRSAIGLAVGKSAKGPFTYKDTLIYSGFTKEKSTDGSDRDTQYQATNLPALIKAGKVSGFSDKWMLDGDGKTYNTNYAPNAIDPSVFFDQKHQLRMVYGSWSGGIYELKLNDKTGLAEYPGRDRTTKSGQTVDRYFGTHLLGGFHQSGEGPYLSYNAETGYYYLYVTYGGLGRTGGYNMREFRSKNPDGPFVDAKGQTPHYTEYTADPINDAYGIKLMGNYQFKANDHAYMSPGGNSVYTDRKQRAYVVYHTRFDNGTEAHEVRVHRLLATPNGWLIPAPFEYVGSEAQQPRRYSQQEVSGQYEFVNNGHTTDGLAIPKATVSLKSNGKLTGAMTGTWKVLKQNQVLIKANGTVYRGVFYKQADESKQHRIRITFSVTGNNTVLFGAHL